MISNNKLQLESDVKQYCKIFTVQEVSSLGLQSLALKKGIKKRILLIHVTDLPKLGIILSRPILRFVTRHFSLPVPLNEIKGEVKG